MSTRGSRYGLNRFDDTIAELGDVMRARTGYDCHSLEELTGGQYLLLAGKQKAGGNVFKTEQD